MAVGKTHVVPMPSNTGSILQPTDQGYVRLPSLSIEEMHFVRLQLPQR